MVIYWELCSKIKFDYTNKWYMHYPLLDNEMQKSHSDFEIKTDLLISARRPDLVIISQKKRTGRILDFTVSADHRVKLKESQKNGKYLDLARDLKKKQKTVEHESDGYNNCNSCSWYNHQIIGTRTGGLGNKRMSEDQTTTLLRLARIRRFLETWGDLLSLKLRWKIIN